MSRLAAAAAFGLAALAGAAAPAMAATSDLDLGGAVRFNFGWRDYGPTRGDGEADLELLRADASGHHGPWRFSAQYRWYEGFDAIHHGWVGYAPDAAQRWRAGVIQVPFGLLPYASHSFWFGAGYYLGLEDDYDLGASWHLDDDGRSWHLALLLGDEYLDAGRSRRYSFDVARTAAYPYRERERLLLRYEQRLGSEDARTRILVGSSAFAGRIEDELRDDSHRHHAAALHALLQRGPGELQLQWARYDYGVPGGRLALSAFEFPFEIADRADVLTANVAWRFGTLGPGLDLTCYNDLSSVQAGGRNQAASWQNVSGCSLGRGGWLLYVDWIAGRNMWFVGGAGVGIDESGPERWRSRLNVNLGYYF